jgi:hypothetical protein
MDVHQATMLHSRARELGQRSAISRLAQLCLRIVFDLRDTHVSLLERRVPPRSPRHALILPS